MDDLKTNENLEGQLQFSPDLGETPKEQVFSNGLLVDRIWKYLSTQDIIGNALVSRAWHAKSRETLRSTNSKSVVYLYIDNDSPCRTLAKFNTLLEESPLDDHISFNGIQLLATRRSTSPSKCRNCLKNELLANIIGPWNPAHEQIVTDSLPDIFGSILGKFQLKYFRIYNNLTSDCPFACFIKHFLRTEPEKILELDFGNNEELSPCISRDLLWENGKLREFLNLEVYGYGSRTAVSRERPVAPSLKKITHFRFRSGSYDYGLYNNNFPCHAITHYTMERDQDQSITKFLEILDGFHPIIEVLHLGGSRNPRDVTAQNFFELGKRVAGPLKKLTCTPLILSQLVTKWDAENTEGENQNGFPNLKTLFLICSINEDALDWYNCVDVSAVFPKLQEVSLHFDRAPNYDSSANGPENLLIGSHRFDGVKRLSLTTIFWKTDRVHSVERACHWLNLFRNVQELNVADMQFKYDGHDHLFGKFLSEIENLQSLKILTIAPPDLMYFGLDHLFSENCPKMKNPLPDANLDHLPINQSSILYHKSLEQVNIQGEKICTSRIIATGQNRCYSVQVPGTFLVSAEIARVICKHRPGFKFCLTIKKPCMPECTSGFWPGGFRLEHLEPFTAINYRQSRAGMYVTRFWEIQFLNADRENAGSYCCV